MPNVCLKKDVPPPTTNQNRILALLLSQHWGVPLGGSIRSIAAQGATVEGSAALGRLQASPSKMGPGSASGSGLGVLSLFGFLGSFLPFLNKTQRNMDMFSTSRILFFINTKCESKYESWFQGFVQAVEVFCQCFKHFVRKGVRFLAVVAVPSIFCRCVRVLYFLPVLRWWLF